MSTYEQQYLGMYIEIENEYEFINEYEHACEDGHIFKDKKVKFCCFDGTDVKEIVKCVPRAITIQDLIDKQLLPIGDDDFCIINMDSSEKTWLIQNLTKSQYGIFLDDADYGAYTLATNSGKVVEEFKEEFAVLLKELKAHCKSVKVSYGLVKYYS